MLKEKRRKLSLGVINGGIEENLRPKTKTNFWKIIRGKSGECDAIKVKKIISTRE